MIFVTCASASYMAMATRLKAKIELWGQRIVIEPIHEMRGKNGWVLNTLAKAYAAAKFVAMNAPNESVCLLDADIEYCGDDAPSQYLPKVRDGVFALRSRTPHELCAGLVIFGGLAGAAAASIWGHTCRRYYEEIVTGSERAAKQWEGRLPEQEALAQCVASLSALIKTTVVVPDHTVDGWQLHAVPEDPGFGTALFRHTPASRSMRGVIEEGRA